MDTSSSFAAKTEGAAGRAAAALAQRLIEELAREPSLVCTVGRDGAVAELFLDENPRVGFLDGWATIELAHWHVHMNLERVSRVVFAEEPSQCSAVSAYVSLDDGEGKSVIRFYFPHAAHTHRTYTPEELALFARFCARYSGETQVTVRAATAR